MDVNSRFTDDEWRALAIGPAAAASAILTTSHPGFIGILKEVRAAAKATKHLPTGQAGDLINELIAYAEAHDDLGQSLSSDGSDTEAARSAALAAIDNMSAVAAKLTPEEREGYVGWVVGIARAAAEAASDKGEDAKVSAAEEETLAEIERRLRGS